ncbi:MAG: hypothetical protein Q8P39_03540 [Candidatus Yanofskybacteria bacterium]|nr:hypothetical protein [Candidatus Yanofskybacteria bacterium]
MLLQLLILAGSFLLLSWAANWLVRGIEDISKYLQWKSFVVAFFIMAIGGTIPNLFLGISSAFHGVPELSFGDMIGNNMVTLTVVIMAAVLFSGAILTDSKIIQKATLFTMIAVILPLLLVADGTLGRGDAIALMLVFAAYVIWLFSKRKHFGDLVEEQEQELTPTRSFRKFLKALVLVSAGLVMLIGAAEGIVRATSFFSLQLSIPLAYMGILVTGFVNAIPEAYFSVVAARRKQNWIVLGSILGAVMFPATFVMGTVALIHPIEITEFSAFAIGRAFLLIAALLFLIFVKTAQKISNREALLLFLLYVLFLFTQIKLMG